MTQAQGPSGIPAPREDSAFSIQCQTISASPNLLTLKIFSENPQAQEVQSNRLGDTEFGHASLFMKTIKMQGCHHKTEHLT